MFRRSATAVAGLAVAAMLAAGCDIEAESRSADGSFDRTVRVDGPVNLEVLSRSGRIDIRTGDEDTVRIVGRVRAYESFYLFGGGYTPEERVRSLESSPPIEQSGNSISVGDIGHPFRGSNVSISYQLTVPADTRLRTSTRSGDQIIELIRGPVVASSRSGSIQIRRVAGDVEVATRSGEVDVRLPADGGATLDVATRSGTVDTDAVNRVAFGGDRRHVRATIGPGGRHVEVRTRSGSVRIK